MDLKQAVRQLDLSSISSDKDQQAVEVLLAFVKNELALKEAQKPMSGDLRPGDVAKIDRYVVAKDGEGCGVHIVRDGKMYPCRVFDDTPRAQKPKRLQLDLMEQYLRLDCRRDWNDVADVLKALREVVVPAIKRGCIIGLGNVECRELIDALGEDVL